MAGSAKLANHAFSTSSRFAPKIAANFAALSLGCAEFFRVRYSELRSLGQAEAYPTIEFIGTCRGEQAMPGSKIALDPHCLTNLTSAGSFFGCGGSVVLLPAGVP
jgi:hypothetical protein